MSKPSDIMEKANHPFDRGYWLRYDGEPWESCADEDERLGWETCNREIKGGDIKGPAPQP